MASWFPRTALEEEIVSLQPEYNFIYGELTDQEKRRKAYQPRPRDHLDYLEQKTTTNQSGSNEFDLPGGRPLNVIRAVHEMAGTKQCGINASMDDWNTRENAAKETIAMIRYCGMGPSVDLPFNKTLTKATLPVEKRSFIRQNGEKLFPVLLDNESFKIVSTRMRIAESAKEIQGTSNNESYLNTEDIKPVPCEEEIIETIEEINKLELKEFEEQFPTLGEQKTKSIKSNQKNSKHKQKPENWRNQESENWRNHESENWRSRSSYSTPVGEPNNWRLRHSESLNSNNSNISNISCNDDSSYYSLNTSNSDDYASAKEFLDKSDNDQLTTYAKAIRYSESPKEFSPNKNDFSKGLNARLYKPKDVYNLKNRKNLM